MILCGYMFLPAPHKKKLNTNVCIILSRMLCFINMCISSIEKWEKTWRHLRDWKLWWTAHACCSARNSENKKKHSKALVSIMKQNQVIQKHKIEGGKQRRRTSFWLLEFQIPFFVSKVKPWDQKRIWIWLYWECSCCDVLSKHLAHLKCRRWGWERQWRKWKVWQTVQAQVLCTKFRNTENS